MKDTRLTTYASLEAGQIIGPERHRFKLISAGPSQPPGQLWLAEDQSTQAPVPVSLLIFDPVQFPEDDQIARLRDTLNRTRILKSQRLLPMFGQFAFRGLLFIATPKLDGLSLAQLIEQKKLGQLSIKQRSGLAVQLGKALHAVQMGRMSHGTLCPELIYLNRGQGAVLLGTGWYNALDPDTSQLSYAKYQLESDLNRGHASTLGDTFALGMLIVELFNNAKLQIESQPADLTFEQWERLRPLLTEPDSSEIKTPLQLVRELFGEAPDAEQFISDSALDKTGTQSTTVSPEQESPSAKTDQTLIAEATEAAARSDISQSVPIDNPATDIAAQRTRVGWDRPIWLLAGILIGILAAQLFFPSVPEIAESPLEKNLADEAELSAGAAAIITQGSEALAPLDPVKDAQTLEQNHLVIFRHEVDNQFQGPLMVKIPTGRFRMGDLQGIGDDNELPVREVEVARSYALSQYEITFEEYDLFAQATERRRPDDEGWGRGKRPVINVSWQDAQDYALWLAALTGQAYRLPSEAEWEYAARAGTETAYWWGNQVENGLARCDGCETVPAATLTQEVGDYPPNPWGVYDLNGNVDEWVADCYSDDYLGAPEDQLAFGLGDCSQRSMRGGSWFEIPRLVRSSSRYRHPTTARRNSWGFRIALDLHEPIR